uniref:Secreted protein n=1 Tax=Ascaris lumbricoides TaxID=6252 RepID=A0A0M3IMD7_ASCLU
MVIFYFVRSIVFLSKYYLRLSHLNFRVTPILLEVCRFLHISVRQLIFRVSPPPVRNIYIFQILYLWSCALKVNFCSYPMITVNKKKNSNCIGV